MTHPVLLSILIPARNEAENLPALLTEVHLSLQQEHFEVIVVDDGSTDGTAQRLLDIRRRGYPQLRILRHSCSLGQSTAILHAAQAARGAWLATLDGDGQNDPADIPRMLEFMRSAGSASQLQLIAGHRIDRRDSTSKRWASRLANHLRRFLLRDHTPDTGCGLKLIERAAFLRLPYFDHMHRYLPALILRQGGEICVLPVNHRPRGAGVSNYGNLDRALVGAVDLLGVWWLMRRVRLDCLPSELEQ